MLTDTCRCPRAFAWPACQIRPIWAVSTRLPGGMRGFPSTDVWSMVVALEARTGSYCFLFSFRLSASAEPKKHPRRSSCRLDDFANRRRNTPQCDTKSSIVRPAAEEELQRIANAIDSCATGDSLEGSERWRTASSFSKNVKPQNKRA